MLILRKILCPAGVSIRTPVYLLFRSVPDRWVVGQKTKQRALVLLFGRPKGAKWLETTTTAARKTLNGLTSGQEYEFRVVAMGTNEVRNYSNVISSFEL